MAGFQKTGGVAALICAATYLFGIVLMVALLEPAGFDAPNSSNADRVEFLVNQKSVLSIWYLVIYIVNAVALAALVVSLRSILSSAAPVASELSGGFGLIWAALVLGAGMVANVGLSAATALADTPDQAAQLWAMVSTIENGLGGGNEIAGSVWVNDHPSARTVWNGLRTGIYRLVRLGRRRVITHPLNPLWNFAYTLCAGSSGRPSPST